MKETNDFIYGALHTTLRKQLNGGLRIAGNETGFTFAELLEHPAVRYPDPGEPPVDAALLRDWHGLPATDTTSEAELHEIFKLEAPLALASNTLPGLFPTNKFSAVPALIRAARIAGAEADGTGALVDARKRLMIVPNCHVQELITETQADNFVRVTGVRVWQNGGSGVVPLAPAQWQGECGLDRARHHRDRVNLSAGIAAPCRARRLHESVATTSGPPITRPARCAWATTSPIR